MRTATSEDFIFSIVGRSPKPVDTEKCHEQYSKYVLSILLLRRNILVHSNRPKLYNAKVNILLKRRIYDLGASSFKTLHKILH